jgi:hypothetical protein
MDCKLHQLPGAPNTKRGSLLLFSGFHGSFVTGEEYDVHGRSHGSYSIFVDSQDGETPRKASEATAVRKMGGDSRPTTEETMKNNDGQGGERDAHPAEAAGDEKGKLCVTLADENEGQNKASPSLEDLRHLADRLGQSSTKKRKREAVPFAKSSHGAEQGLDVLAVERVATAAGKTLGGLGEAQQGQSPSDMNCEPTGKGDFIGGVTDQDVCREAARLSEPNCPGAESAAKKYKSTARKNTASNAVLKSPSQLAHGDARPPSSPFTSAPHCGPTSQPSGPFPNFPQHHCAPAPPPHPLSIARPPQPQTARPPVDQSVLPPGFELYRFLPYNVLAPLSVQPDVRNQAADVRQVHEKAAWEVREAGAMTAVKRGVRVSSGPGVASVPTVSLSCKSTRRGAADVIGSTDGSKGKGRTAGTQKAVAPALGGKNGHSTENASLGMAAEEKKTGLSIEEETKLERESCKSAGLLLRNICALANAPAAAKERAVRALHAAQSARARKQLENARARDGRAEAAEALHESQMVVKTPSFIESEVPLTKTVDETLALLEVLEQVAGPTLVKDRETGRFAVGLTRGTKRTMMPRGWLGTVAERAGLWGSQGQSLESPGSKGEGNARLAFSLRS